MDPRKPNRKVRLILLAGILAVMPSLYVMSTSWEQTNFVIDKMTSLVTGVSSSGLSQGDETERGAWFVSEMDSFWQKPLLGHSPGPTSEIEFGHSSLSNGLVLFGLLGSSIWLLALFRAYRRIRCYLVTVHDRHTLLLSSLMVVASGVLNPTWHSPGVVVTLFALVIPEILAGQEGNAT